MQSKNIKILLIIFAVLLALILFQDWDRNIREEDKVTADFSLSQFDQEDVEKVIIKKDKNIKTLSKKDGGWQIEEKAPKPKEEGEETADTVSSEENNKENSESGEAKEEKVEMETKTEKAGEEELTAFFEALGEFEAQKIASRNPENYGELGIDKENAIVLMIKSDGEETETFFIGDRGPQFDSYYIKGKGSKNVYLATSELRSKLTQSLEAWKDKEEEENSEESDPVDEGN